MTAGKPGLAHATPTTRTYTFLLVDLLLHVKVDAEDDQIRQNIGRSYTIQDLRIVEWDLLR